MGGKGRALDNLFVERLRKTVEYEGVYIKEYVTAHECRDGLHAFFERERQSLVYDYPREVYFN